MDYKIEITDFEGPLDLLLHLVKKSEMNIVDISIEEITKQYLDYINIMENLNLNIASEYLVMAAELIEIKSSSLLPKKYNEEDLEEEENLKENLINKLLEYEKYKEISVVLKDYEESRKHLFTKSPTDLNMYASKNENIIKEEFDINDLVDAFNKMIERKKISKPLNTKVTNKEYSLSERNEEIKNILKIRNEVEFQDLFSSFSRNYVVITFLSILTLAKENEIIILQDNNFKTITIRKGNN